MSTKNENVPLSTTSSRNRWDPLVDSERQKFYVQNRPPLSLRQFMRSTINTNPGGKNWKPSGLYHASFAHEDSLSKVPTCLPDIVVKPHKNSHPIWRPPGTIKYKQSSSSNEKNKTEKLEDITTKSRTNTNSNLQSKPIRELLTPWHPSGNRYYNPVPYFDSPSLRWSPQQIKQSMPEFRSTVNKSPTNQ